MSVSHNVNMAGLPLILVNGRSSMDRYVVAKAVAASECYFEAGVDVAPAAYRYHRNRNHEFLVSS